MTSPQGEVFYWSDMAGNISFIKNCIAPYAWQFWLAVLMLIVESLAELGLPSLMAYAIDSGVMQNDEQFVWMIGLCMIVLTFFGILAALVRNKLSAKVSQSVGRDLRARMYSRCVKFTHANLDRISPASVLTRLSGDADTVQEFVNRLMRMMLRAPIMAIGASVLIAVHTPSAFCQLACAVAFGIILIFFFMKVAAARFKKMLASTDRLNSVVSDFLRSLATVRAFGAEKHAASVFMSASKDLRSSATSAMAMPAVFFPAIALAINLTAVAVIASVSPQESGALGHLMAAVNYVAQLAFAVVMIGGIMDSVAAAFVSSGRIRELLEEKPGLEDSDVAFDGSFDGSVTLKNVSFCYAGRDACALKNLNLEIMPGTRIAIIGTSGSGKSTLAGILARFYDPTDGEVLFGGIPGKGRTLKSIRDSIVVAGQDAGLFSGTVLDNLIPSGADRTEEEIAQALSDAGADFVHDLKGGLLATVGRGGEGLSGGQRQRISIARALLADPETLILDDCTSALDSVTEDAVLNAILTRDGRRSIVLTTQRVPVAKRMDKIICMNEGMIAGIGSHEELMASCAEYRRLCDGNRFCA